MTTHTSAKLGNRRCYRSTFLNPERNVADAKPDLGSPVTVRKDTERDLGGRIPARLGKWACGLASDAQNNDTSRYP